MKKSIASILCVLSFVAFAAPTVSYQTATNIAKKVIDQTLSDALDDKRDKSDRAVYSVTQTENTDWTWTSENKELEAALNAEGIKIKFHDDNMMWNAVADPSGWAFAPAPGTKSDLSVVMYFIKGPEWIDQYPATATRLPYMDETLGPEKPNQQLAAVATDDTAKPADGSLMKYDAANDRLVKAVEGTDYLKTHQDISGKFDATHDFDGESASLSWDAFYLAVHAPHGLYVLRGGMMADEHDELGRYVRTHSLFQKADRATTLSGYGITDAAPLSMISATDTTFASAVRAVPTTDMPEDMPTDWGTYGTVGAALAALAAFVKWAKAKIVAVVGNDGKPTDQFATDLLEKQVANVKANTVSLAAAYSETETYSVGDAVTHDGKLYKCAVAIATAEAWTPAHWTETTVATLWNNADTTSYGGQN